MTPLMTWPTFGRVRGAKPKHEGRESAGRRGQVRVQQHQRHDVGHAQRAAAVEAEPTEPQQHRADVDIGRLWADIGGAFGSKRPIRGPIIRHNASDDPTAEAMHDRRAGEVDEAELRPANRSACRSSKPPQAQWPKIG